MKKILVDIYLAYNLGDDLFLDYLSEKFPQYQFVPFHAGHNYDAFFSKYPNVNRFPYGFTDKVLSKLKISDKLTDYDRMAGDYDGLLFLGGGIFREESYWKPVYQYRSAIVDAFSKAGKPSWFLGCNFGPFATEDFRKAHESLFKKTTAVCFRDLESYNLFQNVPQANYAPDILWAYPLPEVKIAEKVLGISVIDPRHKQGLEKYFNQYISEHQKICEAYILKGFKVRLFSFCEKEGDLEVAKMIAAVAPDEIEIVNYVGEIENYLKHFGACSHVIAARFHANIIAMLYGRKVLPIIYGDKTKNLLDDLHFENEIIYFDKLSRISAFSDEQSYQFPEVQSFANEAGKHFGLIRFES